MVTSDASDGATIVPFTADHALLAWSAVCYSFMVITGSRVLARLSAWRRHTGALFAMLLAMSIGGQLLPCVHAGTLPSSATHGTSVDAGANVAMDMPMDMPMDMSNRAPMHEHDAPASHHEPTSPGCTQLMACGVVVQVAAVTTWIVPLDARAIVSPLGQHLQFATADREVESRPPRG